MKKYEFKRVAHVWNNAYDRWLFIAEGEDGKLYFNYCQGDDYEYFLNYYAKPDLGLSEFFMENFFYAFEKLDGADSNLTFEKVSNVSSWEHTCLNDKIWVYFSAVNYYLENQ